MEVRNRKKRINIYTKFVGCFTKNGQKIRAYKSVVRSIKDACQKANFKTIFGMRVIVAKLATFVDVRRIKNRAGSFPVPVPVGTNRRNYLVAKQISSVIYSDKTKISFEKKLNQELINILLSKDSKVIENRNKMLKEAVIYKSNQHYRW